MPNSMIKKVSGFHDQLARAVAHLRGREVSQAEILRAYSDAFPDRPDDLQWIQAADHSRNHTNKAPCECSASGSALFERLAHGRYRVL